MKILVAYASRKGATRDMAARIARGLEKAGGAGNSFVVDMVDLADRKASGIDLAGYGLVVIGAPSYAGSWHKAAVAWAKSRETELENKKIALFELGNARDSLAVKAALPSLYAGALVAAKLGGEIRWSKLSFIEKLIIKAITKSTGDSSSIDDEAVAAFIATLGTLA